MKSLAVLSILLAAALARPAAAHDTWLLPSRLAVPAGTEVTLDLTSGMAYPAPETAVKPDRVARAGGRLAGQTFDLAGRTAAPKSLRFKAKLAAPGVATLWVDLAPKSIELKPAEVEEYLDEIGASAEVRKGWAEAGKDRRWRELYTKHAKTFVRVGNPAADRSWAEPTGMALEIVPDKDPTALRPGDELPLRVLADGKPLANFPLGLVREGDKKGLLRATDAEGRVTFHLDRSGRWLLRGTQLRRSSKPETDWESDFTTLTLEVRQH
jgi:uncharacterized GH25 family protein